MRNSARKLKNAVNLLTNLQLHQKPPLFPRITKRAKGLNSTEQITRKQQKNLTSPIENPNERYKTRIHRTKLKQTANDGCTSTQSRRKLRKPSRTHAVDGSKFYTPPHGGRLMILPVDENAGNCLVKGSTCAPLQTPVLLQDPLQEPAKEQSGAAAADRTPTPKSVTESPNTKRKLRTGTVQILSHSKLYNSQA